MNNIPLWKKTCKALTPEVICRLKEIGILARPISDTEYLVVYPRNTIIIMKGSQRK